jgi:hypothetical protein
MVRKSATLHLELLILELLAYLTRRCLLRLSQPNYLRGTLSAQ